MTRGAFAADSGRVVGAARDATRALTRVAKEMEARRRTRLEGASVVEVVEELMASGGREMRLKCAEAFLE